MLTNSYVEELNVGIPAFPEQVGMQLAGEREGRGGGAGTTLTRGPTWGVILHSST